MHWPMLAILIARLLIQTSFERSRRSSLKCFDNPDIRPVEKIRFSNKFWGISLTTAQGIDLLSLPDNRRCADG